MSFVEILPLAFVMIAGPQIITSFFLATSERWAVNSLAYVGGAALSITAVVTIAHAVASSTGSSGSGHNGGFVHTIDWIVLVLLAFLVVRVFLTRKQSEPPKWMGKLQTAEPKFAFTLGLLLLGVFPTDIASSVTAGLHVGHAGDPWWQCLPFVALTLLFLAAPAISVVILGQRASVVLPKVRDWMNRNAWIVSEFVLLLFLALTINTLAGG
jgi:Sap, sulfolipid-1-addressing protein